MRFEVSVCDVCNTPGEGTKITADQMRKAAKAGFSPFSSDYAGLSRLETWRAMVQANDTNWNLCGECLRKVGAYLPASLESAARLPELPGSRVLAGHEERLMDVDISAAGDRVLTSGWDKTVRLWDFATGRQLACLRDHNSFVDAVALSPDGRFAASGGGGDYAIRIWDLERQKVVHRLKGHSFTVFSLQFSRDGSRLLSGGDQTVQLWDVRAGKRIRKFGGMFGPKHQSGVMSVAFSPDETQAFSVGLNAILWDVESGKQVRALAPTPLWSGAFLADGRRAIVSGSRGFTLFDLGSGAELATVNGVRAESGRFGLIRGGPQLFSGRFGTVRLVNINSGEEYFKAEGHSKSVTGVAVSADGRRGASASDDWTGRTWQFP